MSSDPQARPQPRVSLFQWLIASASVGLGGASFLAQSYYALTTILLGLFALSVTLFISTLAETFRTRLMGKVLLVSGVLAYYWLEALDLALKPTPFSVPAFAPIPGEQMPINLLQLAYLYVSVFQLLLLVGYSVRPRLRNVSQWAARRRDQKDVVSAGLLYVLALCALVPAILSFGSVNSALDFFIASRSGSLAGAQNIGLLNYIGFFGIFGAAVLLADAFLLRSSSRWIKAGVALVSTAPFLLGGTRHLLVFVAFPTVVAAARMDQGKRFNRRAVAMVLAGAALIVGVQLQFILRQEGWTKLRSVRVSDLVQGGTTGQFTALVGAEALVPATHPYFKDLAEIYFVIHWIPRQFWPAKPIMPSWFYYNNIYTMGSTQFNVTPSVIGQFHMSWGVYGVIWIGFWLGLLASIADRLMMAITDLTRHKSILALIGMFYVFIFVSFRFYSPIYFLYIQVAFICMYMLTRRTRVIVRASEPAFESA